MMNKKINKVIPLEKETLQALAKSWNTLDISSIENILDYNFIYESQWVLTPIKGKKNFINYLESKFRAIKDEMQKGVMTLSAELATHPKLHQEPIIVLTQTTNEELRQVSLLIKIENSKIKPIDACFIPDPMKADLTGEFPK